MNSLILRTSARLLLPAMLIFSVIVLFRGHNDPAAASSAG